MTVEPRAQKEKMRIEVKSILADFIMANILYV
jgi:hypothetical protein